MGEGETNVAVAIDGVARETPLLQRNLFGEAERIAVRAATVGTRRQYAAIYRAFGDWLREQLGRPPVVGDIDADVIAAYGRHLATSGGRGGRPAAPATARVYVSMVRALARQLGREEAIVDVHAPRHEPGPPETLTDTDYANLLRVPDRRSLAGKREPGRSRCRRCARPGGAHLDDRSREMRSSHRATRDRKDRAARNVWPSQDDEITRVLREAFEDLDRRTGRRTISTGGTDAEESCSRSVLRAFHNKVRTGGWRTFSAWSDLRLRQSMTRGASHALSS